MELLLDVRNLTLKISSTVVLQDIVFHLIKGECAALLGLNGAGKSTLIKTLLHLIPDAEGTIFINKVASSNLNVMPPV